MPNAVVPSTICKSIPLQTRCTWNCKAWGENKPIIYSQKANNFGYVEYNSQVASTVYVNGTSAGRREIIIRLKVIKSELRFPPSRDYSYMFSRSTASPLDFLFEIEIVSLTVGLNKQANPSPVDRGCRSKYSPILNASHMTLTQVILMSPKIP